MNLLKRVLVKLSRRMKPLKPGPYTAKLDSVETSRNGATSITLSEVEKQN